MQVTLSCFLVFYYLCTNQYRITDMAYGKWIGAFIGAMGGGVLGALAGFAIGSVFDNITDTSDTANHNDGGSERQQEGMRNSFLFSLMVLSAHIIQADGKIMHSEMETVRKFLRNSFGEVAVRQGDSILRRLFEYRKLKGESVWGQQIREACAEMRTMMPEAHRMQLVMFLAEIAKADGRVDTVEVNAIREITALLGLNAGVTDQFLSLGGNTIDDAYKVLGISPDATDDEVRKAYRNLVRQHHPDRVATLGNDILEAAKKKMQEINEAKDKIYKARGM